MVCLANNIPLKQKERYLKHVKEKHFLKRHEKEYLKHSVEKRTIILENQHGIKGNRLQIKLNRNCLMQSSNCIGSTTAQKIFEQKNVQMVLFKADYQERMLEHESEEDTIFDK